MTEALAALLAFLATQHPQQDLINLTQRVDDMSTKLTDVLAKAKGNTEAIAAAREVIDNVQAAAAMAFATLHARIDEVGAAAGVDQAVIDELNAEVDKQATAISELAADAGGTPIPEVEDPSAGGPDIVETPPPGVQSLGEGTTGSGSGSVTP
jgi:hypothetical protein